MNGDRDVNVDGGIEEGLEEFVKDMRPLVESAEEPEGDV